MPKRDLVRAVATALEGDQLKIASGLPDAAALLVELQAFKVKFSQRGHASFAGAGAHDDLVIAVALVCWWTDARRLQWPQDRETPMANSVTAQKM